MKAIDKHCLLQAGIINFPEEDLKGDSVDLNMRWIIAIAFETGKYKRMFPESTDTLNY